MLQEHVRYSLELSALRHSLDQPQRGAIAKTAIATLCSPDPPPASAPASPTAKPGDSRLPFESSFATLLWSTAILR